MFIYFNQINTLLSKILLVLCVNYLFENELVPRTVSAGYMGSQFNILVLLNFSDHLFHDANKQSTKQLISTTLSYIKHLWK